MKSSLGEKKRIKEYARHPPPVRRWLSFSATALSQCETPCFYSCCATEWLQEAVQLGTSVRKLILSMWLPRSRRLPCMPQLAAKPEIPSHTVKQDITQRKISILHWLGHLPSSYMPPGKTTLKVLQLDCVLSHPSLPSSHDMLMQLQPQLFCGQRNSRATLSVGQLWGIFHRFATP